MPVNYFECNNTVESAAKLIFKSSSSVLRPRRSEAFSNQESFTSDESCNCSDWNLFISSPAWRGTCQSCQRSVLVGRKAECARPHGWWPSWGEKRRGMDRSVIHREAFTKSRRAGVGLVALIKAPLTSAHLVKLPHWSDVTRHLGVAGLYLPVEAGGFLVLGGASPVDGSQEPLGQRRCHDHVQLTAVHQHLDGWGNSHHIKEGSVPPCHSI